MTIKYFGNKSIEEFAGSFVDQSRPTADTNVRVTPFGREIISSLGSGEYDKNYQKSTSDSFVDISGSFDNGFDPAISGKWFAGMVSILESGTLTATFPPTTYTSGSASYGAAVTEAFNYYNSTSGDWKDRAGLAYVAAQVNTSGTTFNPISGDSIYDIRQLQASPYLYSGVNIALDDHKQIYDSTLGHSPSYTDLAEHLNELTTGGIIDHDSLNGVYLDDTGLYGHVTSGNSHDHGSVGGGAPIGTAGIVDFAVNGQKTLYRTNLLMNPTGLEGEKGWYSVSGTSSDVSVDLDPDPFFTSGHNSSVRYFQATLKDAQISEYQYPYFLSSPATSTTNYVSMSDKIYLSDASSGIGTGYIGHLYAESKTSGWVDGNPRTTLYFYDVSGNMILPRITVLSDLSNDWQKGSSYGDIPSATFYSRVAMINNKLDADYHIIKNIKVEISPSGDGFDSYSSLPSFEYSKTPLGCGFLSIYNTTQSLVSTGTPLLYDSSPGIGDNYFNRGFSILSSGITSSFVSTYETTLRVNAGTYFDTTDASAGLVSLNLFIFNELGVSSFGIPLDQKVFTSADSYQPFLSGTNVIRLYPGWSFSIYASQNLTAGTYNVDLSPGYSYMSWNEI